MTGTPVALLVPSRGRPHNVEALVASWQTHTEGMSTIMVAVDDDDPTLPGYQSLELPAGVSLHVGKPARLGEWTNRLAVVAAAHHRILGSIGDDHRIETQAFELLVVGAFNVLGGSGIVYGDDGVHGPNLATGFFVSSDIIRTLGWMCPPCLIHLFVDNAAMELGRAARCLRYVPDLRIAHHHPIAGLAPDDDTYRDGTGPAVWAHDHTAFTGWMDTGLPAAVARIRALRG